ncbi:MAG: hypothetical protein WCY74_05335 [Sphaerochaetaceae bacterium]
MKKSTQFVLLLCALLTILWATGCDTQGTVTTKDVTLVLRTEDPRFARNIYPGDSVDSVIPVSYDITATGPNSDGRFSNVRITNDSFTFQNMSVGTWHFEATAYNADDVQLSSGSLDCIITPSTDTLEILLDERVGSGTFALTCNWNAAQTFGGSTVLFSLSGNNLTEDLLMTETVDASTASVTFTTGSIPAGFYTLDVTMECEGTTISGFSEMVAIIDGSQTQTVKELTIGVISDDNTFSIIDTTGTPVSGTISVNPVEYGTGDPVTLTFEPDVLPAGITVADLTYAWYCDGCEIPEAQSESHGIAQVTPGSCRYDVVVSHTAIGTVGSASITISVASVPSIVETTD